MRFNELQMWSQKDANMNSFAPPRWKARIHFRGFSIGPSRCAGIVGSAPGSMAIKRLSFVPRK